MLDHDHERRRTRLERPADQVGAAATELIEARTTWPAPAGTRTRNAAGVFTAGAGRGGPSDLVSSAPTRLPSRVNV